MKNLTTFLIALCAILILAVIAKEIRESDDQRKPLLAEYHFDVVDDTTIIISDDGDDWETISSDSLTNYLIDNNQ